jgi:hypothetical protein
VPAVGRAVLTLLLVGVLATACSSPQPLTLGVAADDVGVLDSFAREAAAPVGAYQWYQAWGDGAPFDAARARAASGRGALPVLTWEPWVAGAGVQQPAYALARIADGSHDGYIAGFARQVRDWGGRVGVRFLHELNAPHYPWSVGVNGNTAAQYVAAWKHVHDVFEREGAANVRWVWSPYVACGGCTAFGKVYPGDAYVDWVGLDGYNWGGSSWQSMSSVFRSSYNSVTTLAPPSPS